MLTPSKRKRNQQKDKQHVAHKGISILQHCAAFLQRKTEGLTGRAKKYLLALFCLLSGGYSLYLSADSLMHHKARSFSVTPLSIPKHTGQAGDENLLPAIAVTLEEYKKLERFRRYMDSLVQSPSGKKTLDSILFSHPGLMDSIRLIENIYQLQSPKK
jgi:hypothetical protein